MSTAPHQIAAAEQALTRAAGLVCAARVDVDRRAITLDDQIGGMALRWTGSGGLAFQNLQRAWQDKQRTITRALIDFERSLTSTERDFTATDEAQERASVVNLGRLDSVPNL